MGSGNIATINDFCIEGVLDDPDEHEYTVNEAKLSKVAMKKEKEQREET